MDLLVNPITTHKHARWFALIAYIIGLVLLMLCALIPYDWGAYLGAAAWVIWSIPVMWGAYKWSQGGKQ
jgi:hypothetical protein